MRTRSAFYRLLSDNALMRVPINTRVGITTVPQAHVVAEGAAKPIAPVSVTNIALSPLKAASVLG